ncbi:MAG: CD225/dispanin family protein [Acidimicrobiia bacterium]
MNAEQPNNPWGPPSVSPDTGGYWPQPGYGPTPYARPAGPKPDNYLVWSILATILCCWPFGIPAIVNAAGVDAAWNRGDVAEAQRKSEAAKKWTIIAAVLGLLASVIVVIAQVAAATAATT